MRKHISALIAALAVSAILLCGCNDKTESSASLPESSTSLPESSSITPESTSSVTESSASSSESTSSETESTSSIPESTSSTPESTSSTPESTSSVSESTSSVTESTSSIPESTSSTPESSAPAESNPALQKYYEEMIANYFEYVSGAFPGTSPEVARGAAEAKNAGLDKFEKMTVPQEYAARHSAMMKAAEIEREINAVLLDYANGVIDYDEMEARTLSIRPDNRSEFTTHCLNIVAALNHEPAIEPTEDGQMLEVLSNF